MRKIIKSRSFRGFILIEPLGILAATIMLVTFPVAQHNGEKDRQVTCSSNQKQIWIATAMYVQENDDTLPVVDAVIWSCLDVKGKVLECPANRKDRKKSYAYNKNLSDKSVTEIMVPDEIALTADSDRKDISMTSIADIALRHGEKKEAAIVAFVDGHVAWLNKNSIENVLFKYEQSKI